jgi:hypothetical protein
MSSQQSGERRTKDDDGKKVELLLTLSSPPLSSSLSSLKSSPSLVNNKHYCRDNTHDDDDRHCPIHTIAWCFQWILAFPILASTILHDDNEEDDNRKEPCSTRKSWQELLSYKVLDDAYCLWYPQQQQLNDMGNNSSRNQSSLGYGEITEQSVFYILRWIHRHHQEQRMLDTTNRYGWNNNNHHHHQREQGTTITTTTTTTTTTTNTTRHSWCVVDLGSGNGRVLQAALVSTSLVVSKVIGLELVSQRDQQARQRQVVWQHLDPFLVTTRHDNNNNNNNAVETNNTVATNNIKTHTQTTVDLRLADFTRDTSWTAMADVVFIHATVFDDGLMKQLNGLCAECQPGTYFCLVSRPLEGVLGSYDAVVLTRLYIEMSWGRGALYIQQIHKIREKSPFFFLVEGVVSRSMPRPLRFA